METVTMIEQAFHHFIHAMGGTIAPAAVIAVVVILVLVDRQSKRSEYFRNLR